MQGFRILYLSLNPEEQYGVWLGDSLFARIADIIH